MKDDEFEMIHLAIKSRINKEVKELKKLYQATIDGDGPSNFHSRYDNISNSLVLIKSSGNKRFGGFTSIGIVRQKMTGKIKTIKILFYFLLIKKNIFI